MLLWALIRREELQYLFDSNLEAFMVRIPFGGARTLWGAYALPIFEA